MEEDQSHSNDTTEHKHTNKLINESSPYLLQHAHNPVDWHAWGEEALAKAKKENKPLLISIGYSACHWCHVMERESFEDEEVAEIMNEHFVCIKVDREERPDVDQIYMDAVQLMTGRGGWPLNCFALPDGKPFYGGTYYPKQQWINVLQSIHKEYSENPEKVREYAQKLTGGIQQSQIISMRKSEKKHFSPDTLKNMVGSWRDNFDHEEGGPDRAPKFPLPNNYQFLLHYYKLTEDRDILDHCELTLDKMCRGGIYDQIGGGFARYSTDTHWKVPHFEKMLYDNAQLVSLYSHAYKQFKKEEYKEVVYQTLEFIDREMTATNGAFYSALDADSEGEEGKFYIWDKSELKEVLGEDYKFAKDYYNIGAKSSWEGHHILLRDMSDQQFADKQGMPVKEVRNRVNSIDKTLLEKRAERIRPGLDDKSLTSWNALMLKGYTDAYLAFNEGRFLKKALKNANFIVENQLKADGSLFHNYKNGKSSVEGYLEDYCFTIEAFISLYEITFDEKWLNKAKQLTDHAIEHFYDENSGLFFFTSDQSPDLIARKKEVTDNVIPASNSSMANALFKLGHLLYKEDYLEKSRQMLVNIEPYMSKYGPGHSNWGILMCNFILPFYEIAIVGAEAAEKRNSISKHFIPNKIFLGTSDKSELELLKNKQVEGKTMIYVCIDKACKLPVENPGKALEQMN